MSRSATCVQAVAVCLLAALASCDARSLLSMPASQVISNIQAITTVSQSAQTTVKKVVPPSVGTDGAVSANVPNYLQLAQEVQQRLSTIAQIGSTAIQQMQDNPLPTKFSDADGTKIFDAFRTFVTVHQQLLSLLIGKRGIISNFPVAGQGVAAALRAIEGVVDTIALSLIQSAQNVAGGLDAQYGGLRTTLIKTEDIYANPIPDPTALLPTTTLG